MALKGKSVMLSPPTPGPAGFSLFSHISHVFFKSEFTFSRFSVSIVNLLWLRLGRCVCVPQASQHRRGLAAVLVCTC